MHCNTVELSVSIRYFPAILRLSCHSLTIYCKTLPRNFGIVGGGDQIYLPKSDPSQFPDGPLHVTCILSPTIRRGAVGCTAYCGLAVRHWHHDSPLAKY